MQQHFWHLLYQKEYSMPGVPDSCTVDYHKASECTGAVIALLNHQIGCNAGINTTAHGNDCFFIHNFSPVNERIGVPVHREQLRINQEYGIIIRN